MGAWLMGPQAAEAAATMATVMRAERAAMGSCYPPRRRSEKTGSPSDSSRPAISAAGLDGG